jgi:hypothetical protein
MRRLLNLFWRRWPRAVQARGRRGTRSAARAPGTSAAARVIRAYRRPARLPGKSAPTSAHRAARPSQAGPKPLTPGQDPRAPRAGLPVPGADPRASGSGQRSPGPAQPGRTAVRQGGARAAIRTDARAGAHAKNRADPGAGRRAPAAASSSSASAVPATASPRAGTPTAQAKPAEAASAESGAASARAAVPWYERARSNRTVPGHRHCGLLERILYRDWPAGEVPPPEIVLAVDRLAGLPQLIKERLTAGLDAIYVGPGGVPDVDDMGEFSGVMLPSGRATWDACAGAYGDRKIIVGSKPSPTPDVMCHEIGHALDDIDGSEGCWQSDSAEFSVLYEQCLPMMSNPFHSQDDVLGRREFFADAFAAIASSQRPALVEMVGGNTRAALQVMLYFNVRYGI